MSYSNRLDLSTSYNPSKSSRPFNANEVKQTLEKLIRENLDQEHEYDSDKCIQLSKELSLMIKDAMKSLNYEQYKYVIQVVLGQCHDDNLMMTCRCLWDVETDNYASYVYSTANMFCAVTVFGLFYY